MKLIISKTALEMAVKNICRVINTKNALPILGDVLCMVDEQQQTITMTGADTEAWLTYRLALQGCEGGGRFCIGADLLRDALSELPEQPVTILATTESDMKFRLQHESGETVLPLDNADEYPTPRHLEATRTEWTLESGRLKRVLLGGHLPSAAHLHNRLAVAENLLTVAVAYLQRVGIVADGQVQVDGHLAAMIRPDLCADVLQICCCFCHITYVV